MKHLPMLIIVDVPGTPRPRILTRCIPCNVTVTDRKIDASEIKELEAAGFGTVWGEDDGEAWLAHTGAEQEFVEVAGEALEETREKMERHFPDTWTNHSDAVNFALGTFSGIVLRRMNGEPDPDPVRPQQPASPDSSTPVGGKPKSKPSRREKPS